jgi:hypothetical protein
VLFPTRQHRDHDSRNILICVHFYIIVVIIIVCAGETQSTSFSTLNTPVVRPYWRREKRLRAVRRHGRQLSRDYLLCAVNAIYDNAAPSESAAALSRRKLAVFEMIRLNVGFNNQMMDFCILSWASVAQWKTNLYQIFYKHWARIYELLVSLNHYLLGTHNELLVFDSRVTLCKFFFMGVHTAPSQGLIFIENKTRRNNTVFLLMRKIPV